MALAVATKKTVWFVGENGTKAGLANAGGVTLDRWESNPVVGDYVGVNGAAIDTAAAATISDNGSGDVRITSTGDFANVIAGTIGYCGFSATYTDGRYEITAVDGSGNWIDIDLTYSSAVPTVDVNCGGAFDELQNAVDETPAALFSVRNYCNKKYEPAAFAFDALGGSVAEDSFREITAYNTTIGDTAAGGAHYQNPLDALKNGIDTDCYAEIDAGGNAICACEIDGEANLVFKYFYFHNTNRASGNECIDFISTNYNVKFTGCAFSDAYKGFDGTCYGLELEDCYLDYDFAYNYLHNISAQGGSARNTVFNGTGKGYCLTSNYMLYVSCSFVGSTNGARTSYQGKFINCNFDGQSTASITIGQVANAKLAVDSCIFYLTSTAGLVCKAPAGKGSFNENFVRNCCAWSAGGALSNHILIGTTNYSTDNITDADPLFVDRANHDYRLQTGSPCFNTGTRTPATPDSANADTKDGYTDIGLWQRKSFAALTAPTLSIVTGEGSVTATIAGQSGADHYLKYKASSHSSWQSGGSRNGDGILTVSSLDNDVPYIFIAYSQLETDGPVSAPSVAVIATLTEDTDNDFDQELIDEAAEFLDKFGEDIKYLPSGGGQREIRAIVDREPPGGLEGAPQGMSETLAISVANDSTTGISGSEVNRGGDKVELAVKYGEAVQERTIKRIFSGDAGMMKLEVR